MAPAHARGDLSVAGKARWCAGALVRWETPACYAGCCRYVRVRLRVHVVLFCVVRVVEGSTQNLVIFSEYYCLNAR